MTDDALNEANYRRLLDKLLAERKRRAAYMRAYRARKRAEREAIRCFEGRE